MQNAELTRAYSTIASAELQPEVQWCIFESYIYMCIYSGNSLKLLSHFE